MLKRSNAYLLLLPLLPLFAALFILVNVQLEWENTFRNYLPIQRQVIKVRNDISEAHLWLEEAIAGDSNIDMEKQVFIPFRQEGFKDFLLVQRDKDIFEKETLLIEKMTHIEKGVDRLYRVVLKRWSDAKKYAIGSFEDEKFDVEFNRVLGLIDATLAMTQNVLKKKEKEQNFVFMWSVISLGAFEIIIMYILVKLIRGKEKLEQELVAQKELMEYKAHHDALTGLQNRLELEESLKELETHYTRYRRPYAIIMIDIDHFKNINDTHGHPVGDEILKSFAKVLSEHTRAADIVGRWGGEEFMIICKETDIRGAHKLAETIRTIIETYDFNISGRVTASFGVSEAKDEMPISVIVKEADDALYLSKNNGRNQTTRYDPSAGSH